MSAETWIAEFYPVAAENCPEEKAIEHSLQKWIGLRASNLKKHGLEKPLIEVDDSTCALCKRYFKYPVPYPVQPCASCPLFLRRDGVPCYDPTKREGHTDPFEAYCNFEDPEPMIRWLRRTLKAQEGG